MYPTCYMDFRNTHANLLCAAANKFEVYEKVCHHKQYSCNFFSLSCICGRLSIMYVSSWQKMTCICPNSISLLNNEIKFLQTEVNLQYRYLLIFRFNYHTWTSTSEYKIFLLFKAIQNMPQNLNYFSSCDILECLQNIRLLCFLFYFLILVSVLNFRPRKVG